MVKTKHYGPWGPTAGHFIPLKKKQRKSKPAGSPGAEQMPTVKGTVGEPQAA